MVTPAEVDFHYCKYLTRIHWQGHSDYWLDHLDTCRCGSFHDNAFVNGLAHCNNGVSVINGKNKTTLLPNEFIVFAFQLGDFLLELTLAFSFLFARSLRCLVVLAPFFNIGVWFLCLIGFALGVCYVFENELVTDLNNEKAPWSFFPGLMTFFISLLFWPQLLPLELCVNGLYKDTKEKYYTCYRFRSNQLRFHLNHCLNCDHLNRCLMIASDYLNLIPMFEMSLTRMG